MTDGNAPAQRELVFKSAARQCGRQVPDTSRAAEARLSATRTEQMREMIMDKLRRFARLEGWYGMTSNEIHFNTARFESEISDVRRLMEIRRRVSDLHTKFHLIRDTGLRRTDAAGSPMIVWAPVDDDAEK